MTRRDTSYTDIAPQNADAMERLPGLLLLDFGTDWCGHCSAARPSIDAWLAGHTAIEHVRIEDGPGRKLGRAHRVKLWPTLVLIRDGDEIARVVRPRDARDLWPLDEAVR